jgi:hypothetical protein
MAEKIGDRKAIILGAVIYALGWCCRRGRICRSGCKPNAWLVGSGLQGPIWCDPRGGAARGAGRQPMSLAVVTAAARPDWRTGGRISTGIMSWQAVFCVFAAAILAMILTLPFMRAGSGRAGGDRGIGTIRCEHSRIPATRWLWAFFPVAISLGSLRPIFLCDGVVRPDSAGSLLHSVGITTTSPRYVAISPLSARRMGGTPLPDVSDTEEIPFAGSGADAQSLQRSSSRCQSR